MANDSLLWQRRMGHAHDQYSEPTCFMPTMSMAFRPDAAAAAAAASMPLVQRPPQQYYAPLAPAMPSHHMVDPFAVQHVPSLRSHTFDHSYNAPNAFGRASFGSLSWQTAPLPAMPITEPPSFHHSDSQSSSDSEATYIKTEEDWPMQTYQLLDESDIFASPKPESIDSSDESKPTTFSTDIDTLMRTIQCKAGATSQPVSEPTNHPDSATPRRPRKRYICDVAGCEKSFSQKTHLDIHTVSSMATTASVDGSYWNSVDTLTDVVLATACTYRPQTLRLPRPKLRPTVQPTRVSIHSKTARESIVA